MERALIILCIILSFRLAEAAKKIEGIVVDTDSIPVEFANITAFVNDSVVGLSHMHITTKQNPKQPNK